MVLIVDGYNVMHALPASREWPGVQFKDRRRGFLEHLGEYAAGKPHRITVIFDGTKGGEEMGGADQVGSIAVRYSPRGVEADDLIRRMLDESTRPSDILLVTSDKSVSFYARTRGASTARADELIHRLFPRPAPEDEVAGEHPHKGVLPARPAGRPRSAGKGPLALW